MMRIDEAKIIDYIQELLNYGMNKEATVCKMMAEEVTGRKLEVIDGEIWWS